jgi:hypothetical protein
MVQSWYVSESKSLKVIVLVALVTVEVSEEHGPPYDIFPASELAKIRFDVAIEILPMEPISVITGGLVSGRFELLP